MIRTILWKELREQWLVLLAMFVFSIFCAVILGLTHLNSEAGSVFEGYRFYVIWLSVANGLILINRLVSREYRSRTQQFLITLPLSRFVLVTTKFLFGLTVVLLTMWVGFFITAVWGRTHETLSKTFLFILFSRASTFSVLAYCVQFFLAHLGRFQITFCITFLLIIASLDISTKFVFTESFPVILVDKTFSFEREIFPTKALLQSLGFSVICIVSAFVLALYKDGTIPDALSKRMSHQAKVFVTGLLLLATFGFSYLDSSIQKEPYKLLGAVEIKKDRFGVSILPPADTAEEKSEELGTRVANTLSEVADYLQVKDMPNVFITSRKDLAGDEYELGHLKDSDELHVRVNSMDPDWSDDGFLRWVIPQALIIRSKHRVELEPTLWVLEGFPSYWMDRDNPNGMLESEHTLLLRALYGTNPIPSARDINQWLTFREKVGPDIASAVGWSLLRVLHELKGEDQCRGFIGSVLGIPKMIPIRNFLIDWKNPPEARLQWETGIIFGDLLSEWKDRLDDLRAEHHDVLGKIPILQGGIEWIEASSKTRMLRYHLTMEPIPTEKDRFAFLYCRLPPFDKEVSEYSIKREDCPYEEGKVVDLDDSFSVGDRVYWTLAYRCETLDCEIITGWNRETVK